MSDKPWIWFGMLLAAAAQATTLTLTPVKDNTLYENSSGSLSNGSGQYLFAGRTTSAGVRRALLAFDLSSVPAGAELTRVALTLTLSKTNPSSGAQTLNLRRVLADWGEGSSNASGQGGQGGTAATGDATWIHTFSSTSLWAAPGGDFSGTLSASQSVAGAGSYTWESAQLLTEVQSWVTSPTTNFGWVLLGDESSKGAAKRFSSRESATAAQRPKLTLEYTPANIPPTAGSLPDLHLPLRGGSVSINPAAAPALFRDADGDLLSYTVANSDTAKVAVVLMENTLLVTPRTSGIATLTLSATDGRGGTVALSFWVEVNTPPTLAAIPDQTLDEDHATGVIGLSLGDAETNGSLTLSARSDNTRLLPSSGIALGGTGASRTLKLTPAADQSGSATLTLTVSDGSDSTSRTFALKVNPVDDPPVVTTPLPPQTLALDRAGPFSIDLSAPAVFADPEGDTLSYTASSSDTAVVAATLSGHLLFLAPRAAGSASLTLSVDDGKGGKTSTIFGVAVTAPALQLTGDFDGNLSVGFADFFLFADHFGEISSSPGWNPLFDLSADNSIGFADFFLFADHFGEKAAP